MFDFSKRSHHFLSHETKSAKRCKKLKSWKVEQTKMNRQFFFVSTLKISKLLRKKRGAGAATATIATAAVIAGAAVIVSIYKTQMKEREMYQWPKQHIWCCLGPFSCSLPSLSHSHS